MEFLGTALRWLQLTSGLVLFGSFSLLLLAGSGRSPDAARWRGAVLAAAPWLVALLLATAAGLLMLQAASVSGRGEAAFQWSEWARLLERTRYGAVWQVRQATALVLLLLLLGRGPLIARFGERVVDVALLTLALAINAAAVFTGHGAATEPLWLAGAGHAVHLLAAGAWAGGLPALVYGLYLAARGRDPLFRQMFFGVVRRFSVLATVCVALIVASGILIAYLQFGAPTRWPARTDDILGGLTTVLERSLTPLLATPFGLQVLAKVVLLVPVLLVAARVRWVWMPRMDKAAFEPGLAWRGASSLVRVELGVVLLILLFAAGLTGTLPAAHAQMVWPLPFRLSFAATWDQPGVATTVVGASLLALGGLALLMYTLVSGARVGAASGGRRIRLGAAVLAIVAGLAIDLSALSVVAYPDTYRRTDVSYNAVSVTRGAALFSQHCMACHGELGKGDGPQAARLPTKPADLTAPHTALHTAGDIFWWLTHGKPQTAMPGFAQEMRDEERWDMVNFLRAFSAGFQARILTPQVVPGRPWLGPPDFDFLTRSGLAAALKEYRERKSVLLVFYSQPFSAQRLAELARLYPRLQSSGTEVITIALPGAPSSPSVPFSVVTDGAQEAATAYLLFRRTLRDPGKTVLGEPPSHMEFLIDRFGYVRARWLPQDEEGAGEGWRDMQFLLDQIERINREPKILPPPDDHVH
ncbi:c-type cytochrome [Rhodoferax sp.]|uniref:c-type cytochrome n=1 Tax=Rhodoferax sp. TaxID=50421 RepID=UPI003BB4DFC3